MPLRFAVISAYHDEDWHSRRLVEACARHGAADVVKPLELGLAVDAGVARVTVRGRDATRWDVFLTPRALGDKGDPDLQCMLYRAVGELGVPVVNPVAALLEAEDKPRTSLLLGRAGVATPAARAAQTIEAAERALRELGAAVVKPPYGSLGVGVERVSVDDTGWRDRLEERLERHGVVYLQRYVPPRGALARDLRLFVVGGEVIAAMERVAPVGEFRTNIHQGGEGRAYDPPAEVAELAVRAVQALGLHYAGVDLLESEAGPTVLEVNGTPLWRGLLDATGRDMAEAIAAHAARLGTRARRESERSDG